MGKADLHIHTVHSDGQYSPEQVVEEASEAGLSAVAITDHDAVSGIEPAVKSSAGSGVEVAPGVELSSYIGERGFHIVGLFVDFTNERLLEHLGFFRTQRYLRAEKVVNILNGLNIGMDMEDVLAVSGGGAVGRPHIAQALLNIGAVSTFDEAFKRYIGKGRPAYVAKYHITPDDAAEIIHDSGGVAILAHPGISARNDSEIYDVMSRGMDGLEVSHPRHNAGQESHFKWMARQEGWLMSGGSDSHGPDRDNSTRIGNCAVDLHELSEIRTFSKNG